MNRQFSSRDSLFIFAISLIALLALLAMVSLASADLIGGHQLRLQVQGMDALSQLLLGAKTDSATAASTANTLVQGA